MSREEVSALDKAIKHYQSLFTIPRYSIAILFLLLVDVLGGLTLFWLTTPTMEGARQGLFFGLWTLALPSIGMDLVVRAFILDGDRLFTLRRCTVTTLSGCLVWIVASVVGIVFGIAIGQTSLFYASFFYGSCVALSIRYLVLRVLASSSHQRVVLATVSQPIVCLLVSYVLLRPATHFVFSTALAGTVLVFLTYLFIESIDGHGKRIVGIGAIQLFRAFVLDWAESFPDPLEKHFEKIGRREDVSVAVLAFGSGGVPRAYLVVPMLHPGPFRDVGSSRLPFMIQETLERRFNVIAMVPHGTSGHEMDLTSQRESARVLDEVMNLSHLDLSSHRATRLVRAENSLAKATCQMFDNCAFMTITCAPREIEDIPREVGLQIVSDGIRMGVETVVVVDAHNSISSTTRLPRFTEADVFALREAAKDAISKALQEPYKELVFGVAKVVSDEFDLRQGMGPGGIVALVLDVGGQRVAYVTIDGNNMIVNLRDKILGSLYKIGIDEGEVMTTDTHMVNAVTMTRRGYHPIGEVMDQDRLISHINRAVNHGLNGLGRGEVAFKTSVIRGINIIGDGVVKLSLLVDSATSYTKRLVVVMVPVGITTSLMLFRLLA